MKMTPAIDKARLCEALPEAILLGSLLVKAREVAGRTFGDWCSSDLRAIPHGAAVKAIRFSQNAQTLDIENSVSLGTIWKKLEGIVGQNPKKNTFFAKMKSEHNYGAIYSDSEVDRIPRNSFTKMKIVRSLRRDILVKYFKLQLLLSR